MRDAPRGHSVAFCIGSFVFIQDGSACYAIGKDSSNSYNGALYKLDLVSHTWSYFLAVPTPSTIGGFNSAPANVHMDLVGACALALN